MSDATPAAVLSASSGEVVIRVVAGAPTVSFHSMIVRGRIVIEGGSCEATSTTFESCVAAADDGGAIKLTSGTLAVRQSTFKNNRASQNGGAVHIAGGTASFDGCEFSANSAGEHGGGLHASGGTIKLGQQTLITGNTATSGKSIHVIGSAIVTYTLPAPLGRWIFSSASAYQTITGSVESDYPFPCA